MTLSPEERQRIYEEEKARLEIRKELELKRVGIGAFLGWALLGTLTLLAVIAMIGGALQEGESTRFKSLSPERKQAETLQNCASLRQMWAFKTYGELTQEERKAKFSCEFYESQPRPNSTSGGSLSYFPPPIVHARPAKTHRPPGPPNLWTCSSVRPTRS